MNGSRAFTDLEIKKISDELSVRDRAIFIIGIRCGLRISEILSLRKDAVVDQNKKIKCMLSVEKKNVKGKFSGRVLPIHEDITKALTDYLGEDKSQLGYLFPGRNNKPLDRTVFHKNLKNAQKRAKIDINGRKTTTHSMRKAFAQKFYKECGEDLYMTQKALGHRDINSTTKYMEVDMDKVFEIIRKIK